jgi:ATP-dependent protease ClpP protease subunit
MISVRKSLGVNKIKQKPKKKPTRASEEEVEIPLESLLNLQQGNDSDDSEDYTINEYYLYNDISIKTVMGLLKFIKNAEKRWKNFLTDNSDLIESAQPKPIKIFINSNGGDVFAAIPLIDAISNCSIPIHTYIEGIAASSASLISMAGHKRFITKNSFMLIHELRSGVEGTYSNIVDEKENCDKLMKVIKDFYLTKTNGKIDNDLLQSILKRDLILSSEECKNIGLIDEII